MTTKQEYKKKMKQLAIMEAAETIFLKKPYSWITVNEIAKMAGVTKRTLYQYFPSKLALFVRMFENYLKELHKRILDIEQEQIPPERKLLRIFVAQFSFSMENQDFMRLFWTLDTAEFDGVLPEELAQSIRLWNRDMIDISLRVIREGQEQGVIMPCAPEMLVHMMSAFNKGVVIHTNKEAKLSIADVDGETLHHLFIDLISNALFPRSDSETAPC